MAMTSTVPGEWNGDCGLVLLITPSDRCGDAHRLDAAGMRVVTTSRAESSLRQVVNARPAVVAIEWLPSFAEETLAYLAQVILSTRGRAIPVLVYGDAPGDARDDVARCGGEWVDVTEEERDGLVLRASECLVDGRPATVQPR
jgi:hypothetical protein